MNGNRPFLKETSDYIYGIKHAHFRVTISYRSSQQTVQSSLLCPPPGYWNVLEGPSGYNPWLPPVFSESEFPLAFRLKSHILFVIKPIAYLHMHSLSTYIHIYKYVCMYHFHFEIPQEGTRYKGWIHILESKYTLSRLDLHTYPVLDFLSNYTLELFWCRWFSRTKSRWSICVSLA